MKIHNEPPRQSRSLMRVKKALEAHAPRPIEFTQDEARADHVVLHVIGRRDHVAARVQRLRREGKPYSVIQHAIRSTRNPKTADWIDIWRGATVVWSYYDLEALCRADGTAPGTTRFLYGPLGVDHEVFNLGDELRYRNYLLACHAGKSVEAVTRACAKRGVAWVLGAVAPQEPGSCLTQVTDASDEELASKYRHTQFVAGLAPVEGFELMAVEGLLCGARPILFDRMHYRQWYGPWGEFVPETRDMGALAYSLILAMQRAAERPVTAEEVAQAARRFDWRRIVKQFWMEG